MSPDITIIDNTVFMDQRQTRLPRFSIVIPTLNEGENIYPLMSRIFDVPGLSEQSFEVVVVDDSSTDGTRDEVRKWQTTHPVNLICRENKDGLAGAVIEGARCARGDVVVVMDADLSHPPEIVPELIGPILDGSHDMVIGSRYTKGGSTPDWPMGRKLASWLATLPARILTDPEDPLAGFFAVKRENLAGLDTTVSGFKIGLEVLVAGGGNLRVAEVPITFYDRYRGMSKMSHRIIFEYFHQVLGLCGVRPAPSFTAGLGTALIAGGLVDSLIFFLVHGRGATIGTAQMAGFAAACIVTGIINCKWTFGGKTPGLSKLGGMAVVSLLALVLRGGILEDLLRLGTPAAPAVVLSSLVCIALLTVGLMFYVFPEDNRSSDVRARIFCLGVIVFALVLRLIYLGLPALLEEEAYYWNYAQHPAMGYLDHPPMVALLINLGTALFGTREFAVRIGSVLCWFITAGFSYALTRSLYNRLAAFRAVMLLSVLPVFFAVGLLITPDAPLTACWSAVIYFLYRALLLQKPRAWLGVGIFLGLGMFSKYTIALLGPSIVLFLLIDRKSRRWFANPWPYIAVLVALVLFSPVILWNAQHHWASFLFQSERRVDAATQFATPVLLGSILLLLTPAGVLGCIAFLFHGHQDMERRRFLFFLLLLVCPLAVFFFFSLTKEVKLNWTGPLWLALVPFLAATMDASKEPKPLIDWCRRMWPATAVALLMLSGLFLHYYSLGLPGIATSERPFLTGWEQLAGRIETIVDMYAKEDGKRPVVVGMDKYRIASGLAFYRKKNALESGVGSPERAVSETTAWHIFGWNALMYGYWFPPAGLDGKDLLLVAFSKATADKKFFALHVQEAGPIRELDVRMAGRTIDHCYVRLVRGYHYK